MTGILICVSNKVLEDNIENNRDSEDSSLSEEETITKKGPKSENNKILEDERKLIGLLKTLFSNGPSILNSAKIIAIKTSIHDKY